MDLQSIYIYIKNEHHKRKKNVKFKMDIVGTFQKPLERQVREGIEIFNADAKTLMNSKMDHYQPAIKRVVFTNQLRD